MAENPVQESVIYGNNTKQIPFFKWIICILVTILIFTLGQYSAVSRIQANEKSNSIQDIKIEYIQQDIRDLNEKIRVNQEEIKLELRAIREMMNDMHKAIK